MCVPCCLKSIYIGTILHERLQLIYCYVTCYLTSNLPIDCTNKCNEGLL